MSIKSKLPPQKSPKTAASKLSSYKSLENRRMKAHKYNQCRALNSSTNVRLEFREINLLPFLVRPRKISWFSKLMCALKLKLILRRYQMEALFLTMTSRIQSRIWAFTREPPFSLDQSKVYYTLSGL